jgi:hypothetical protein
MSLLPVWFCPPENHGPLLLIALLSLISALCLGSEITFLLPYPSYKSNYRSISETRWFYYHGKFCVQ